MKHMISVLAKNKCSVFRIIISVFIFIVLIYSRQSAAMGSASSNCSPEYFDEIIVEKNQIVVLDRHGYLNKFIIQPNREIKLHTFDDKGNEIGVYDISRDVYADIGEEVGEDLELIEWNDNVASFKLKWSCGEPACIPSERKECVLEVKDNWKKDKK